MKRILAILLTFILMTSMISITVFAEDKPNLSKQLMTAGNQFVYADSPETAVRLTGVNVPGSEWTGMPQAEKVKENMVYAIDNWNANLIRLPVSVKGWYGDYVYVADGGKAYREYIDDIIKTAGENGVYVILSLYEFKDFSNPLFIDFWNDAAVRYKNNPTVLFGLLNEPIYADWETWKNGDGTNPGHQRVVEMIRDLGAKNIIVASGFNYAKKLQGITQGYALTDQGSAEDTEKAGYGIAYDVHITTYEGLTDDVWHKNAGAARMHYPVIIGVCGWLEEDDGIHDMEYDPEDPWLAQNWCPAFLNWLDDDTTYGSKASYAAYGFHVSVAPALIEKADDWSADNISYTPTSTWGVYVKEHLAGCTENTESTFIPLVYGDPSGDGKVNNTDFACIKNYIELLTNINKLSNADLNRDGQVNATDIAILKNYIELDVTIK